MRSRQITQNGIRAFHRATTADGADRSGLTALTYTNMFDYAVDAAVAVALANTLFFAAATAESKTNVALYLAITVAPFALVAPVIGPLLDRLQRGRRAAMAVSFAGRGVLAVVMALNYETWLLYPAALGAMVLSKSCTVLKAAVTPRVLPSAITLVTTNSRLTVFGLVSAAVFGGIAGGFSWLWGSPGALFFTAALCAVGVWLCLRIPRWVESTAGEVPATVQLRRGRTTMSHAVAVALWGNGAIRVLTGFLTLFVAFVVKAQAGIDATQQLSLIGIVGGAAGVGAFAGNFAGSRMRFGRSDTVIVCCIAAGVAATVTAVFLPGIALAAIVALVAATTSAVAKVCLDAVIQRDLPEESRASAFGRSETVLQLAWVFGGALGVLLPHDGYQLGFAIVAAVVALTGVQTALVARGQALLPFLRHRAASTGPTARVGS
jgi:MFS family permease